MIIQGLRFLVEIIHNLAILKELEKALIEHQDQVQVIPEPLDQAPVVIEQVRLQEILEIIRLAENQVAQIHVHIVKEIIHLERLKWHQDLLKVNQELHNVQFRDQHRVSPEPHKAEILVITIQDRQVENDRNNFGWLV